MKTRKNNKPQKNNKTFNKKDYKSNDGMLTTIWGPGIWHFLHTMSFNYPVEPTHDDKKHYRDFVLSLEHVLPCGKCRKNLHKNLKKLPLTMEHMKSRETFSLYVYKLHETVNKMLNKDSGLTYEEVRERYEHFRARCLTPNDKLFSPLKKEKGCVNPIHGEKSKCVLHIVPFSKKCETLNIDPKCMKKKIVLSPSHM